MVRLSQKAPATTYRLATVSGVPAVEAVARNSMALLARPLAVDLTATAVLCWRWLVDTPVANADMRKKAGDDFAARIYVTFDIRDNQLGVGTKVKLGLARRIFGKNVPDAALNYVWNNRNPVGARQRSAYTDRAQLIASDTDNSGGTVRTAFADIHFVPRSERCRA